jgi:hypothetical protein
LPNREDVSQDTLKLAGGSVIVGVVLLVFVFGPLRIADGLYAAGLWPRLSPDEVYQELLTKYHSRSVTGCSKGLNGWDYVCNLDPKQNKFYDKMGVMGGPFGIAWSSELPPGQIPDREAYVETARARFETERGER